MSEGQDETASRGCCTAPVSLKVGMVCNDVNDTESWITGGYVCRLTINDRPTQHLNDWVLRRQRSR